MTQAEQPAMPSSSSGLARLLGGQQKPFNSSDVSNLLERPEEQQTSDLGAAVELHASQSNDASVSSNTSAENHMDWSTEDQNASVDFGRAKAAPKRPAALDLSATISPPGAPKLNDVSTPLPWGEALPTPRIVEAGHTFPPFPAASRPILGQRQSSAAVLRTPVGSPLSRDLTLPTASKGENSAETTRHGHVGSASTQHQ